MPDLYEKRIEAIVSFSVENGFKLFGRGWDSSRRVPARVIDSCYMGPTPDKHETLKGFRFNLCFENTRFDGYVTEKIFDSFFAGAIPVYLGAPDVTSLIPADSFVNVADFASPDELRDHLRSIGVNEAERYRDAARRFLASPAFDVFHEQTFVEAVVEEVTRAAKA